MMNYAHSFFTTAQTPHLLSDSSLKMQLGNYLTIILPKVVYEAPELNVSGRDTSTLSMNFVVLYDETLGYMAKAVIGNDGINGDAQMTA